MILDWSGPESIKEAHRDSDLGSGPPAVDARLASLLGTLSSRRGDAGRDWAGVPDLLDALRSF